MASITNHAEDAFLNILRGTTLSGITPYLALFTVAPGEAGGGTEVTGGSYARTAVTFGAPSAGVISNSGAVTFPVPSAGWGDVVAWAIMDAASGGNMWTFCNIDTQTVNTGATVTFLTGQATVSLSHASLTNYFRDACLNVFRGTAVTGITTRVGLFTTAPTQSGGGTEVTGGSYARVNVTFGAPASGVITNPSTVSFATPSAGWGTVTAWAYADAASAGNLLFFAAVSPSQTINTGNSVSFGASGLTVTGS
jgi:hypothetical protein